MDTPDLSDSPDPGERLAKVEQRIEELKDRRRQLAEGSGSSAESVQIARRRAEEAMQRATDAHVGAAISHAAAARAHESAANTLQRAAMDGAGDPRQLQDEADEHWQAAEDNRAQGVEALSEADDPSRSSSGDTGDEGE